MNYNDIKDKVRNMLPEKRYRHSENVANCAAKISEIYGYDKDMAYLAGIVHDCAKYLSDEDVKFYVKKYDIKLDKLEKNSLALSHSIIGSYICKYEYNIENEDVISAVRFHTTGRENMSLLEKIIYMADLIEEDRNFDGVEKLRELVYSGKLDEALLLSFNNTIKFVIDNNQMIHEKTIKARNYMLENRSNK